MLFKRALAPTAVLKAPSVLNKSAVAPKAVLLSAALKRSDPAPVAVLNPPVLRLSSESQPTAVLYVPVVRLKSAFCPSAVLPPGYPPSGGGLTACAFGNRPKQTNGTTNNRAAFFTRIDGFIDIFLSVSPPC